MAGKRYISGSFDERVRSDCRIEMEIVGSGGNRINIKSKVGVLFGESIRKLIEEGLDFFNIKNSVTEIDDKGALPFVIMARLESVIKKIYPDETKKFLPEISNSFPSSTRDRFRRSRLYLPGDQPKLFINAGVHKPDGIILDLEDSVSPSVKDDARLIVRNALRAVDFLGAERMVRINQLPLGLKDLEEIIPENPDLILIPKVESGEQIKQVEDRIDSIIKNNNGTENIFLMPIIESALGVLNSLEIAVSSKKIASLAIGLEDYTADIGTVRSKEGKESFFARSMIVNAAKAAGIQAIDTVFSDVNDMDGLMESVLESKALGFDGKGCIHPRQIQVVHDGFSPSEKEIGKAKRIVLAFEEAEKKGLGVVSLGSKMIDPPVVKRALKVIELALRDGKLDSEWRESDEK